MKFPVIEVVDRYAISVVKFEKTNGANQDELEFYSLQMQEINIALDHELILKLIEHHKYVWSLEDDFKKMRIDNFPLEEIAQRAISVRDAGCERVDLKNKLAILVNDPVREYKQDHVSESPKL